MLRRKSSISTPRLDKYVELSSVRTWRHWLMFVLSKIVLTWSPLIHARTIVESLLKWWVDRLLCKRNDDWMYFLSLLAKIALHSSIREIVSYCFSVKLHFAITRWTKMWFWSSIMRIFFVAEYALKDPSHNLFTWYDVIFSLV